MSYLEQDSPDLLNDLARRKEFYQHYLPETDNDADINFDINSLETNTIIPKNYQAMVKNFLNPNTGYDRLLLKWDPGMGKTIAALLIAMEFVKLYRKRSEVLGEKENTGTVFIIGFSEHIFRKELLNSDIFGFVTNEEIRKRNILITQYEKNRTLKNLTSLQDFENKLNRRITNRKDNGLFKFYGYKAFVNRIFNIEDSSKNIQEMDEQEFKKSLTDGSLKWNKPLLDSFKNSLIIGDEIHNTYNSSEKNNWGIAIQSVLNYDKTTKALFMSATPLNNNPEEIVDLLNLLNSPENAIEKKNYFQG